jgi:hypothetical protein
LQEGESPHPIVTEAAVMQNVRSFAAALRRSDQEHWQESSQQKQQQSSDKNKHHKSNQILGQPEQAKNVNINATDDVSCLHYSAAEYDRIFWHCDRKGKGCYHNYCCVQTVEE